MIHNAGKNLFIASVGQYNRSPHVRTITESGNFFIVECGILGFGIWVTAQGIREPTYDWNPESMFH